MNIIEKLYCRTYQTFFRAALPALPYREPEKVDSVDHIPALLKRINANSVLLVTDSTLCKTDIVTRLLSNLADSGISCAVYDGVNPNPTVNNIEEAFKVYKKCEAKAIIAFGGGSPMDCAKAVGARAAYPQKSVGKMKGLLKVLKPIPPLIAVPTTAGTGSEVTVAAVITDSDKQHKYTMNNFTFIPRYAVLDPAVTVSLPKNLTATTGMDALTHAVEAYIGRSTTVETRKLALDAVKLIFENIEIAYSDGGNITARKNMLTAAHKAGIAFSKSYVGYIHAVAHSLGGQYNIPHGLANAVLLPIVLEEYGSVVYKKLHRLGIAAGVALDTDSDEIGAKKFIEAVKTLNIRMGIPEKISGINERDIAKMSRHAAAEANPLYPVPKLWSALELQKIYVKAMDRGNEDMDIAEIVKRQRKYFQTGQTLPVEFRVEALRRLYDAVKSNEADIENALKADLGKSDYEGFMCETGLVLSEISYMLRHIHRFAKEHTVYTPLTHFPSRSYIKPTPYGNTLIMSPWNYPFLLTIDPLVDAIAAGNTAVVKPSAYSPATSKVIAKMLGEIYSKDYVAVVTGGRKENAALLEQKFDFVFFTGSQGVGKEVLRHTAENLTPAILELGGKSPCIVDETANIQLAARRIVFGKYLNCGQTCVAPDYILCHESVKDQLITALCREIKRQYGEKPLENEDYGKIVNEKHFERLCGLIDPEKVVIGGESDVKSLKIAPTLMDNVNESDAVMQEEIFGPILPVLTFETFDKIYSFLTGKPKPLALYIFSSDRSRAEEITSRIPFGGGCVNDVVIHLATSEMSFGGVGESGMGAYHGKVGFDAFSHTKSIVDKKTWLDLPMRYQPYKRGPYGRLLKVFLR